RVNHPENRLGEENSQDIWFSTLQDDGTWGKAIRLSNEVNLGRYNAILSALDDGKSYLILGHYNKDATRWLAPGFSIVEQINPYQWSKPTPIKVRGLKRMNKGRVVNAYMSPDRKLLVMAFTKSPNGRRLSLYVSTHLKENVYTKPKLVKGGPKKATKARSMESPYLSADKNRIYFSADYGAGRDNLDIYYAERLDDTYQNWSAPVIVTDTINTPNWDSYFKMNAKESWAYYSSITSSVGKSDIFRVKIYEEFPFLKLSGLILNQVNQSPMLEETGYKILVNDEESMEMKINTDSASYEIFLPLGEKYTLLPQMENWNGISTDIDLSTVREYDEANINLYFSAIPFVQVKGQIVDVRTGLPIPLSQKPMVLIDGLISDSVVYDKFSGAFQALLPLGESYTFTGSVKHFTATPVVIDVTEEVSFTEKDITLYVTSVPWVQLKGLLLDNNSLTPIMLEAQPKLLINGEVADSVQIDPVTGAYSVNLPFGRNYILGVAAKNYKTLDNQVDLTGYEEFVTLNQNIFAEREDANMVSLSGKIINTKTGKQLEEGFEVKMRVNSVESRAFVYDEKNASYTLKLPIGFNYDLTPRVINFYNRFEPVDLTSAAPMSKIVRNFYVTPIEVGQSVDIENIYFETGKALLKPESFRSLNALVEFLNEYPNVKVEIGGHTDNVGSLAVNERISKERAFSVAEYVIAQGVPAHRVVSKGYAFSKPKASNRTAEGRAQNRRVDFTIIGI
ncbi:MAG: OmpA family protein, partial [Bacteroidales bacterium]|nr:OmpA family protein [Bacteroidales bacterium]MDD3892777.1 OmpA family protein [Bacteroidales bacterium]